MLANSSFEGENQKRQSLQNREFIQSRVSSIINDLNPAKQGVKTKSKENLYAVSEAARQVSGSPYKKAPEVN